MTGRADSRLRVVFDGGKAHVIDGDSLAVPTPDHVAVRTLDADVLRDLTHDDAVSLLDQLLALLHVPGWLRKVVRATAKGWGA